ncbi:hypothetical protein ABPG75_006065 [Micractinium tetrahymenae]
MGLLKHKGQKKTPLAFTLHIHALDWPRAEDKSLVVVAQRGSHSAATRRAAPSPRRAAAGGSTYVFEEQLSLPVTLYSDAAAARKGAFGPFLPKELRLAALRADASGKPAGPFLGSVALNLAEYASNDGRASQQAFTLAPIGARLLVTIGCGDSKSGGGLPGLERSLSSLGTEQEEDAGGLPISMSTDEEGSRPSSAAGRSRPGSSAAVRSAEALAAVPEESAAAAAAAAATAAAQRRSPGPGASPNGWRQSPAAAAAVMPAPQEERSEQLDDDGFLVEGPEAAAAESQQASASVRRNLGSVLERAEASEVGSRTGEAASVSQAVEVQSLPSSAAPAAGAAGAAVAATVGGAFARLRSGNAMAVPVTPADELAEDAQTPEAGSTGRQSSILSAAPDPAVPFSVPPSTTRRFAQRDAAGAGSRRWAWRREGGGAAAGAAAGTAFQRARLASTSRPDSPASPSDGANAAGAASVEASAHSASSSGRPSSSLEVPAAGGGAGKPAAAHSALQQANGAAAAGAQAGSAGSAPAGTAAGITQFQPAAPQLGGSGVSTAFAAAAATAQRQRSGSGLGFAPLRTTISLVTGESLVLPSPADHGAGPPTPLAPSSLVVEALLQELRAMAALESAVYLAGGKRAFSGDSHRLHTPARRLARTIISLGPQEGLAFGLQAVRAIEATAGAASGDLHRLTFWWSNVLQLRWMFWALCHGQVDVLAGAGRSASLDGVARRGSDQFSPRTSLVAAAAARSGQDWMQVLVPQLRELEAWLFGEMLRHLWWRVLLQSVTTLKLPASSAPSGAGTPAAGAYLRAARSAPHLQPQLQRDGSGVEQASPAALQGTPRSFESPEEEAVQRWVQGLRVVEAVLKEPGRPAPAPRQHLSLLHRQLVVALLRRLDTLLFRKLLAEDGDASPRQPLRLPSMSGRSAFDRTADADEVLGLGGAEAAAAGLLEPAVLPFQRGPLTFGTGVHLKMAVSCLAGWAADCGVKEAHLPQAARSTDMSDYRLFPCLRATADLLMMPKEVLTDREMRREVVPGLPLHRICQLLQRFEPDDCAPDPLLPGLLEALQSESPRSDGGSTPSPTAKAEEEYLAPQEVALLADGLIEPLTLEMGEESEDELESLAAAAHGGAEASPAGSAVLLGPPPLAAGEELRASRFALLRDLWATAG